MQNGEIDVKGVHILSTQRAKEGRIFPIFSIIEP